jgi:peroxiredoxin
MTSASLPSLGEAFARARDMDASLHERLATYSDAVRRVIPSYADAVDRLVERLSEADAGANAPRPGEPMPAFLLPDEGGKLVGLDNLVRDGPVAITFHRGHWCPWCRISLRALVEAQDRIMLAGAKVAAIIPERAKFAAEFRAEAKSPFPVLSDIDNGYALALNLAVWVGPDLERLLASYGRTLPEYQGNSCWLLPIPATFVVGRDGRVAARFIDPDFRRRATVEQLVEALEAAV